MERELKISTAPTRLSALWENSLTNWNTLIQRLQDPHITHATVAQYQQLPKTQKDDLKDVGGFVGGHLAHGRRRKGNVLSRSLIALDLDTPTPNLLKELPTLLPHQWVAYSTASHTPEQPRLRILIPLTRDVDAEQYTAISRRLAADIGIDAFDDTTYEAHRLMYWPARHIDGEYLFEKYDGPWLNPDDTLARFDDWRDITTWPTSTRQAEALQARAEKQANPLDKPGLVGAFCRTYTIDAAIDTFLPDTYTPATNGRWTYKAGESTAGVITYDDKFSFSHHGTDPAGGQLVNAFDLVRIHRFSTWDEDAKPNTPTAKLPSYKAMIELAQGDKPTNRTLNQELLAQAAEEFGDIDATGEIEDGGDDATATKTAPKAPDWMDNLHRKKSGELEDTLDNLTLIVTHDPRLQEIRWNALVENITIRNPEKLPWAQIKPGWSDTDVAQLKLYLEKHYGLYSAAKTAEALAIGAASRAYHPIKDYLSGLPKWDGTERVDKLLIDYLGAPDTAYTRAVTRKTLVAGIARVMKPGIKYDTVLILNGPQGTGKSTLFSKLAGEWFSDALTLTDMRDKTGAEKLQGYWILELGELAGMRKMEVEVVKGFLTRTDDKYRAAYARTVESHPRQCIIVGSTNAENGFLRDTTGNRRFWPVVITGQSPKKSWDITTEDIAQIWAETLHYYKEGEQLHLTGDLADAARAEQDSAIEADERIGLVETYLDTPLPEGWEDMSTLQRQVFLGNGDASEFGVPVRTGPTRRRETVSNIEIWAEAFGKDPADMRPQRDGQEITAIMQKIQGWEKPTGAGKFAQIFPYGRQRIYRRKADLNPPF